MQELRTDQRPKNFCNKIKFSIPNSYFAETMVCSHLSKGNVMGIFGPQDDYIAEHIKSITDMVEVPFIDTRYVLHNLKKC